MVIRKKKLKLKRRDPFAKVKLCPGCRLRAHRRHQIIGMGSVPAELLFVGEGPDKTEDLLGESLVGPSGALLETMIREASVLAGVTPPSYYITNTVLCRPWIWNESDPDYGSGREPTKQEVLACMPNVVEIARVVRPKLVVFIGKVAEKYYRKEFPGSARITHPAFHLRYGGKASPIYLQDVRTLADTFRSYR